MDFRTLREDSMKYISEQREPFFRTEFLAPDLGFPNFQVRMPPMTIEEAMPYPITDWDKECDLLLEWLDYRVELRIAQEKSKDKMKELYKIYLTQGFLIMDQSTILDQYPLFVIPFEIWSILRKMETKK